MKDFVAAEFETEEEKLAQHFLMAAVITHNSWRFNFFRTCKFDRISSLPLPVITEADRCELVRRITACSEFVEAYIYLDPFTTPDD